MSRVENPVDRGAGEHGLTAAGAEFLETAQNLEQAVRRLDRRVLGRDARLKGRLRISGTDNFLNRYLAPHFVRFAAGHCEIDLDILTGYQHLSLARRDADVAIRTTLKPPETLIGKRLPHVLCHPEMRHTARVRVFTRFIADAIRRDRDLFEGSRCGQNPRKQ